MLKKILGILLLLIIVALVAALFLPKDIHVERTATIDAPPAAVFNQVNQLKNWEKWSPWFKMDPDMVVSYNGNSAGKGASYSWEGPETGTGTLTITDSKPFNSISTALDFGDQGTGYGSWSFVDKGNQTEVTWGMDTNIPWPFNLMGLRMDASLGPQFEEGLANLAGTVAK